MLPCDTVLVINVSHIIMSVGRVLGAAAVLPYFEGIIFDNTPLPLSQP